MLKKCDDVSWSDSYSFNEPKVDEEHKQMLCLIQQLFNSSNNQKEVFSALKQLIKYIKFHFTHEERFMRSIKFKDLIEHKQLHRKIVDDLYLYIKEKDSLAPKDFAKEVAIFIKNILIEHILTSDKKVFHTMKDINRLKSFFKWKESYSINNKQIDEEHRKLFSIALKALDIPQYGKKKYIRNILKELNKYMQEHFAHEEEFMLSINYPEYENHKEIHRQIIMQMNVFINTIPELSIAQFERKLIEYMDVWLINHIIIEDNKIICFQNSQ